MSKIQSQIDTELRELYNRLSFEVMSDAEQICGNARASTVSWGNRAQKS
jgi:hypothetical protein